MCACTVCRVFFDHGENECVPNIILHVFTFAALALLPHTAGWGIAYDGISRTLIVSDGSDYLFFWSADTFAVSAAWDPCILHIASHCFSSRCTPSQVTKCNTSLLPVSSYIRCNIYMLSITATHTLQELRRVRVVDAVGRPRTYLNELEYVHGWVFANVWQTNSILIIDPSSGSVVAEWDCGALSAQVTNAHRDVLNGIAYSVVPGLPGGDNSESDAAGAAEAWGGRFWITGKLWDKMFEVQPMNLTRGKARRRRQ